MSARHRQHFPRHEPARPVSGLAPVTAAAAGLQPEATLTQEKSALLVIDIGPVAVGAQPVQILDVAAGRRELRFINTGAGNAKLGGSKVTAATGIPVKAGLFWVENSAPDAEWWMVSDTATTIVVQVLK